MENRVTRTPLVQILTARDTSASVLPDTEETDLHAKTSTNVQKGRNVKLILNV